MHRERTGHWTTIARIRGPVNQPKWARWSPIPRLEGSITVRPPVRGLTSSSSPKAHFPVGFARREEPLLAICALMPGVHTRFRPLGCPPPLTRLHKDLPTLPDGSLVATFRPPRGSDEVFATHKGTHRSTFPT